MPKKGNITIKKLAEIMNVSTATITNALTGKPNVSERLRKEIQQKAEEIGYRPNVNARALVKNGIRIAVMMPAAPVQFSVPFYNGIQDTLEHLTDYKVELETYSYSNHMSVDEAHDCVRRIIRDDPDGLILAPPFNQTAYLKELRDYLVKKGIPVVKMEADPCDIPYTYSICINADIVAKLVMQFISLAFGKDTCVGVITTSRLHKAHCIIVDNLQNLGEKYGLHIVDILENDDTQVKTYEYTKKLINDFGDKLDVIYVTSFDSITACRCIEDMGKQDRIKVVGHDVYGEMVKYMEQDVLISSIFLNPQELGRRALSLLTDHILGHIHPEKDIMLKPELVLKSNLECYICDETNKNLFDQIK